MAEERSYLAENAAELARLRAVVGRLGEEELARPMPAGWTVAGTLAHMAMWDARAIFYLDRYARGVEPVVADYEPEEIDWVNDMAKPLCLALPPGEAAALALRLAEEADAKVAALDGQMLARVLAVGSPFDLARANHRREHLDEIEAAIGSAARPGA